MCACFGEWCPRRASTNNFRGSIVVSISACHAEDPGSIPGRGILSCARFLRRRLAEACAATRPCINDTVSERLRRWTRNPLGSARRGSNPLGVVYAVSCSCRVWLAKRCANEPGRTRTCNPRLRGPMPYPLGHGSTCQFVQRTSCTRNWAGSGARSAFPNTALV